MASAIAFPAVQPPGYEWLDDEPIFDPAAHLEIRPRIASRRLSATWSGPFGTCGPSRRR